jgi:hypothetical protein
MPLGYGDIIIILNDAFIHFPKNKVKLCAYIKKNTINHDEFIHTNQRIII